MDIKSAIDDFTQFKKLHEDCDEILKDEKLYDVIFRDTNNPTIKKFILNHKLVHINNEQTRFIYLTHHTDKETLIEKLKTIDINTKIENKTLLENTIQYYLSILNDTDLERQQLHYIIFLLEKKSYPNLQYILPYLQNLTELNSLPIIMLTELMYMYGAEKPRTNSTNQTFKQVYDIVFTRSPNIKEKVKHILDDYTQTHKTIIQMGEGVEGVEGVEGADLAEEFFLAGILWY